MPPFPFMSNTLKTNFNCTIHLNSKEEKNRLPKCRKETGTSSVNPCLLFCWWQWKKLSQAPLPNPLCVQVGWDQLTVQAQHIFSHCFQAHWTIQCQVVGCQWDRCYPGTIYHHQYRTKTKWHSEWALSSVTITLSHKGVSDHLPSLKITTWIVSILSQSYLGFPVYFFALCCATTTLWYKNTIWTQKSVPFWWWEWFRKRNSRQRSETFGRNLLSTWEILT